MSPDELLLAAVEQSANAIAALTGMRTQFIEAGWSEHVAELMVLEILRQGNKQ